MDQVFELFDVARRDRRAARLPGDLRVGPPGLRDPRARRRRRTTSAPILDLIVEKVPPAARRSRRAAAACRSRRSITTTTSATWRSAACAPAAARSAIACCSRTATARRKSSASRRCSASRASSGSSSPRRSPATSSRSPAWQELNVGETITSIAEPTILPLLKVDAPTITMNFRVNDGPFAGKEGKYVTSRNLARAPRSARSRATSRCASRRPPTPACSRSSGRGELHLTVLIETMRREGYELCVVAAAGHPPDRRRTARSLEPYEDAVIDLDENYVGAGRRRAQPPPRHDARDAAVGARAARASSTGSRRAA